MSKYWTDENGRRWLGGSIEADGRRIFNPTDEQLVAAGYTEHEVQPYVPTLADVMARKLAEIDAYNTSEAVDSFILNGASVWLDYDMRNRTRTKIKSAELAGKERVTLWFGTIRFELPCALATQLIWMVEDYASECYDVTAAHKAAVEALDSIEAVEAYDYTQGYPEKLTINTK